MQEVSIMLKNWPEKGRNVIFYPRRYVIDENNPNLSYVEGVSQKGVLFTMRLELNNAYLESIKGDSDKTPPTLENFARTDRAAKTPCFASENNGPDSDKREGVLLFSRVFPTDDKNVFVAGWAVALAYDSSSPEPLYGFGRMEIENTPIRFETPEVVSLHNEILNLTKMLETADNKFDLQSHIIKLKQDLDSKRKMRFRAVVDKLSETEVISPSGERFQAEHLHTRVFCAFDKYTTNDGRYGGVTVRVRRDQVVLKDLSFSLFQYFVNNGVSEPDRVWGEFLKFKRGASILNKISKDPSLIVELIPSQRINCGPKGNALYKKASELSELRLTYTDSRDENISINATIAARLAPTRKGHNLILSSIFATTSPIGNVLSMDTYGKPVYKIDYIERKFGTTKKAA